MGRQEKREYTVGRFWLARREESPFWQIRWYDEEGRTTRHLSTRRERLEDAIPVITAHEQADRAKGRQTTEQALAVPLLMLFWDEHGKHAINSAQVASSLRQFIGFLMQDKATVAVTVKDLTPDVFRRFIRWRTGSHSYALRWQGKDYAHSSPGVKGESVQRNLDDIRAALNHHADEGRLPFAPKVASVSSDMRSPARDVRLTIPQLGAILAYSLNDIEALRWVLGMLATAARPDAVLKWKVKEQWTSATLFNTHPSGAPLTKKRNAVVPVIPEFAPWLAAWRDCPHPIARSRKTWWRTMRAALDLPTNVVPKTIRHTVATEIRARGVPQLDVEGLLGHLMSNRVTAVYAKYDPARLASAKQQLSAVWREVWTEALLWLADHFRTTSHKGASIVVVRESEKC